MATVFFDTSALYALCVREPGTPLARALWQRADAVVASRLAGAHLAGAVAASQRAGLLTAADAARALDIWRRLRPGLRLVEYTADVAGVAETIAGQLYLDGPAAVEVASALILADVGIVMATWDEAVAEVARSLGLTVVP